MLPLPRGRVEGAVLPGRGGDARRRRLARRPHVPRAIRGHLLFLASTAARREAERARRLLPLVAARCAALLFRGERGRVYRDGGALARAPATPPRSRCGDELGAALARRRARAARDRAAAAARHGFGLGLRLAAATLVLLVPGRARRARAADAGLPRPRSRGRSPALAAGARRRRSPSWLVADARARCCSRARRGGAVALPFAARAVHADAVARRRSAASRSGSCSGASPGDRRRATRCSTSRRVRKLDDFGSLTLRAVDEFRDGGLHPGYAFPLWHGVPRARRAARRASTRRAVVLHESSRARAARVARRLRGGRRRVPLARRSALAVPPRRSALFALAPGHGGSYRTLALPATAARLLLVPAALALVFRARRATRRGRVRVRSRPPGSRSRSCTRPTRSSCSCRSPASSRVRCSRARDVRASAARSPRSRCRPPRSRSGCADRARDASRATPKRRERRGRSQHYPGQVDVSRRTRYRLAPEVLDRTRRDRGGGARARPARRARAAPPLGAFVLGGTLLVLALMLVAELFTRFSDARLALAVAPRRRLRAAPVRARRRRGGACPRCSGRSCCRVALVAGIVLQPEYPGDFGYGLGTGGPAVVTWFALVGGAAALVVARSARAVRLRFERPGVLAGAGRACSSSCRSRSTASASGRGPRRTDAALPPGLVAALRDDVPERSVVFSDPETSYRIAAAGRSTSPPRRRRTSPTRRRTDPNERAATRAALPRTRRARDPAPLRRRFVLVDRRRTGRSTCRRLCADRLRTLALPRTIAGVKVLLVTLYFPPAGGGGVQRPLKFATHLPALGIETHVLAPDDPKWIHRDDELPPPTQRLGAPRALRRAEGPQAGRGAARHAGARARADAARSLLRAAAARPGRERDLEPDRDPGRDPDRARARGSTSCSRPRRPRSVHLVGAAVQARRPARAGSPTCATRSSRTRTGAPRALAVRG